MKRVLFSVALAMVCLSAWNEPVQANCWYWPHSYSCQPYFHHHCHYHWHHHDWCYPHHHHSVCHNPCQLSGISVPYPQISHKPPHHCYCGCPKDCRAVYYGSGGIIILFPAIQGVPRRGHGSIVVNGALCSIRFSEIINVADDHLYFRVYWTNCAVLRAAKIKIACRPDCGKYSIYISARNSADYKLLMCACLKCEPGGSQQNQYEDGEMPEGGYSDPIEESETKPLSLAGKSTKPFLNLADSRTPAKKPRVTIVRKSSELILELERQGAVFKLPLVALVLDDDSAESRPAPKTRISLRGRWTTPAETRIVTGWDDAATDHMPVVQVLPAKKGPARKQEPGEVIVVALDALSDK